MVGVWGKTVTPRCVRYLIVGSSILGFGLSFLKPELFQIGRCNVAFVLFIPMLALLIWGKGLLLGDRMIGVWFWTGLMVLSFFARKPGTHWYNIVAPWVLLSSVAVDGLIGLIEKNIRASLRFLIWAPVIVLMILFGGHTYLLYVRQGHRYAESLFGRNIPIYWTPFKSTSAGVYLYGVPVQRGWKALGYLYRSGTLRGRVRLYTKKFSPRISAEWYVGHKWDTDENSRYLLYLPGAERLSASAIERTHDLSGRILVRDEPRMLIYERKDMTDHRLAVDYRFEEHAPQYVEMASLDERLRLGEVGADSKTFYREAGLIEEISEPGDEILFTDRYQVGLFSFHYSGELPYRSTEGTSSPEDVDTWFEDHVPDGKTFLILWAPVGSKRRGLWDSWIASTEEVTEKAWHGNMALAIYGPRGAGNVHLLEGTRIGESIELLGHEMEYDSAEKAVLLVLYWAATQQLGEDYTVFTHLVDSEGTMLGQKDNQPVGGLLPTSVWRTNKVVRDKYEIPVGEVEAGEYWVEVGMYDAGSGQRLPASGEGALPDGRIRLPLSVSVF